ncbi:MAG: hypothetical protein ACSHYA_20015, partial [Opitutaceae bacterium]
RFPWSETIQSQPFFNLKEHSYGMAVNMFFLFIAPNIGAAATFVDGIKPATSWPRKRLRRWHLGD